MTSAFGPKARKLFSELGPSANTTRNEVINICRVDKVRCDTAHLDVLRELVSLAKQEGYGEIKVFDAVEDVIDLAKVTAADLGSEEISIVLEKIVRDDWCYFITDKGFELALTDEALFTTPRAIWVATDFEGFSTATMTVTPWNGPREHELSHPLPEQPRKLVRDLTFKRTPAQLGPWLLRGKIPAASTIFAIWRKVSAEWLAYALPSEVRGNDAAQGVVLKGPRSAPIEIGPVPKNWDDEVFASLTEAVSWVYTTPREAETKFQFLNNHLSLDWQGASWPGGLTQMLPGSLANAREAFAFHLQDQSKEALKTLGDLRKALQDEVARAQAATRDLLSALWRDLAIAGVVLALKNPTASQITSAEILHWVTLATAVLLLISLCVTIGGNWRFNALADKGRIEWRGKLYAFLPDDEWKRLVERPIRQARRVYRLALPFVMLFYLAAAYYLFSLAEPVFAGAYIDDPISSLWRWFARMAERAM